MRTHIFHVKGMHCKACIALIEGELGEVPEVTRAKASLNDFSVEVAGEFGDKSAEHVARDLSEVLKVHGYSLALEKEKHTVRWSDFYVAIPIALGFIALFILLQKLGVVNLIGTGNVGYGTAFLVGLVASVSTCMAVVGGLVLSFSANFAKSGEKIKPQVLFHVGRLVSFFFLGGLIGVLGSAFQLGGTGIFILGLLVAVILLILGINLLDVFPWMKKIQPTLPSFITKHVRGLRSINHTLTPILIGIATFFLPCGFTQSMQIYALSTGDFWTGAMTMFVFALGTLPVLALLSFSSFGIHNKVRSSIFFRTAGLVVIFFGLFNLLNSLVAFGVIQPLFSF